MKAVTARPQTAHTSQSAGKRRAVSGKRLRPHWTTGLPATNDFIRLDTSDGILNTLAREWRFNSSRSTIELIDLLYPGNIFSAIDPTNEQPELVVLALKTYRARFYPLPLLSIDLIRSIRTLMRKLNEFTPPHRQRAEKLLSAIK